MTELERRGRRVCIAFAVSLVGIGLLEVLASAAGTVVDLDRVVWVHFALIALGAWGVFRGSALACRIVATGLIFVGAVLLAGSAESPSIAIWILGFSVAIVLVGIGIGMWRSPAMEAYVDHRTRLRSNLPGLTWKDDA